MKDLALSLLVLIVLTGCGGGKKKTDKGSRTYPITEEEILEVMGEQKMECASINGNSCPSGISRLITVNKANRDLSTFCSGFMVGPTTLVTNHHCVSTSNQCSNTHIAIYDRGNIITTKCKRIIKTKQDYNSARDKRRKLDYTVMEITSEFNGRTLPVTQTPARVDETINAWVVDHTGLDKEEGNVLDSRITQLKCKVMDQDSVASLVLENCPVISGNSGSPALNSFGEVIGVIWGSDADYDSSMDLRTRRSLDNISLVTEAENFINYVP